MKGPGAVAGASALGVMDHNFMSGIRQCVETMRKAGINDVNIGWIVYEIRAQAIHEERRRQEKLAADNPPSFSTTGFQIADLLKGEDIEGEPR